jgi:diphthamide biosynthesis protein 3
MPLYDEIEIEDMRYDPETKVYSYPCPCGDRFKVSLEDLWDGEDIADCQSCTLYIEVIYDEEDLQPLPEDNDDNADDEKKEIEQSENVDDGDDNNNIINKQDEIITGKDDDNDDEFAVDKALDKLSITSQ